jgi:Mrp family chromosome partitioning ATPase
MSDCGGHCSSCGEEGCGDRQSGPRFMAQNKKSNIKKVIGVVSGKGGVGKSSVCSMLAAEMNKRGYSVAILDADVTGPSIPRTFGVKRGQVSGCEDGLIPAQTESGIKVMSVNLLLPEEDTPVAWRGPVVSGIISQFWNEVCWGDVDYMFVDMPPGTSDVFLTVFQSLPVDGIVTVSAPQELVAMIVGKAVNLAGSVGVPVVGLVENMAYYECDECGKKHYIFGEPQGAAVAEKYKIPAVATLPLNPNVAQLCDKGEIETYAVNGALDTVLAAVENAFREEAHEEVEEVVDEAMSETGAEA